MAGSRREDLAWAAGLWDGEGCVTGGTNGVGGRQLKAMMSQKDRRVLERLIAVVGGKIYPIRRNDQWSWQLARRESVMLFCWLIWPWLDVVKREQFESAFERYHGIGPGNPGGKGTPQRKR